MNPTFSDHWLNRIRLGEDSTLELKRIVLRNAQQVESPHPDSLADELAAFANASGGTVLLGVDDKTKEVLGIPHTALDTVAQWLAGLAQDRIKPSLDLHTRHVELPDASGCLQPVVIVTIPRSLMVHRSPNGYFKRVGHAKREMEPETLARLFQQRSQVRLIRFDELPIPRSTADHAEAGLIKPYLRAHEGDPQRQLQRLHLLAEDDGVWRLSVAGALLCTHQPTHWLPSAYVQAVAYRGEDNDPEQQLDAKDFTGPIDRQVWDAVGFVRRHMLVPARKNAHTLGRVDYPQYSVRAVFEAVVNAVAHRDYSLPACIRLHVFSNRLELYSPGALINSMTPEAMPEMSMPRNEVIANLFARYYPLDEAGFGRTYLMDRRGAGVDVILKESEALSGIRPQYQVLADMELKLTLFAAVPPSP